MLEYPFGTVGHGALDYKFFQTTQNNDGVKYFRIWIISKVIFD